MPDSVADCRSNAWYFVLAKKYPTVQLNQEVVILRFLISEDDIHDRVMSKVEPLSQWSRACVCKERQTNQSWV